MKENYNRKILLDTLEALKICYPKDPCQQIRHFLVIKERYPLGFMLPEYRKTFDTIHACRMISTLTSILTDPKRYLRQNNQGLTEYRVKQFISFKSR